MTLKELQEEYHYKIIRMKKDNKFKLDIPNINYKVTAVIDEGNGFIFAIMAVNYTIKNKRWYSLFVNTIEELEEQVLSFEIVI